MQSDTIRPEWYRKLSPEYEKKLRPFGLDFQTLAGNSNVQHLIFPAGADKTLPLRTNYSYVEVAERHGLAWQTTNSAPFMVHFREVPEWLNSDAKIRELVRHRFPGAFTVVGRQADPKSDKARIRRAARRRAGELAACLYLAFRMFLPYDEIGVHLNMDPGRALRIAFDGRTHGDLYFSGQYCCTHRRPA